MILQLKAIKADSLEITGDAGTFHASFEDDLSFQILKGNKVILEGRYSKENKGIVVLEGETTLMILEDHGTSGRIRYNGEVYKGLDAYNPEIKALGIRSSRLSLLFGTTAKVICESAERLPHCLALITYKAARQRHRE